MSEEDVTCRGCARFFVLPEDDAYCNLPHVLLCGHIFCSTCLRAHEAPETVITCPQCQIETKVEEGIDGLEVDSRIVGLIYKARMNAKKGRKQQHCSAPESSSPSPSAAIQIEEPDKGRPDAVLEEALQKGAENLNKLETLYQTFSKGIEVQLKKERTRLYKEIDKAVEKAKGILMKRQNALISSLKTVDHLFSDGQRECKRIKEKANELRVAVQKARHVQQVPSIETYCNLEKILEILQAPVDEDSFNVAAMSLQSGFSCDLQVDNLTESLKTCIKITNSGKSELENVPEPLPRAEDSCSNMEVWDNVIPASSPAKERVASRQTDLPCCPEEIIVAPNKEMKARSFCETTESSFVDRRHQRTKKGRTLKKTLSSSEGVSALQPKLVFPVVATHIENPGHFYVRYMTEHKFSQKMAKRISQMCSDESSMFTFSDVIKTDSLLFVLWKEDVWYRVRVTELFQSDCAHSVNQCPAMQVSALSVFCVDYGFSKSLSISSEGDLSSLNRCVRKPDAGFLGEVSSWSPLAIRCSLKDIVPSDMVRGWSSEATEEMKHQLGSGVMQLHVLGEDGETLLVDVKKGPMVSLCEYLIFMEFARFYSPISSGGVGSLLFYPAVPPKLNTEVSAMVSHVNTPSDFYLQLVENMEYLLLHSKLQDVYSHQLAPDSKSQIYCPSLSQPCAAPCDQVWYRGQIVDFAGGRLVEVRFVDVGFRKTLSVTDLRKLKHEFFALPEMAAWCSLADVSSVENTWSSDACSLFKELIENRLVTVVSHKHVPASKPLPVSLFEFNEECTGGSIGEMLVKKNLAVYTNGAQVLDTRTPDPPSEEQGVVSLVLPTCLDNLKVCVTHISSPGNIGVQLLQCECQLRRIHETLKSLFSETEPQETDWKPDMFCAAKNNGVWERGQVVSGSSGELMEVLRCDFGGTVKVPEVDLRPLPPDLVGSFLLECSLACVRPTCGRSTWTATATDFISHCLTGATTTITIKDPSFKPVPVSLFFTNQDGQIISMADVLVREGLAFKERVPTSPQKSPDDSAELSETGSASSPRTPPAPLTWMNSTPENVQTQAYPLPLLPPCGRMLMSISAVSEQGVIYAMTPQAVCESDRLRERLQQHINKLPRQRNYNWKNVVGCVVMGPDMQLYRGQVLEVIGGHVKVRYVDQGLVESIPVCHVYPVVLLDDVPQLCAPCQLSGVRPLGGRWQGDAVELLRELLVGRSVNVHIVKHPEDPSGCVSVEIIVDFMMLNKILVHHQYATFDPDSDSPKDCVVEPPDSELDQWDLNTEGFLESKPVLSVYPEMQLPKDGKSLAVKVKHIRTPTDMFLCVMDESLGTHGLEEALNHVNESTESLSPLTDFYIDGPCLAQYTDGRYYRAKLLGFPQVSPSATALIRHVDFGSDDVIAVKKLRELPESLLQFPCAALYVKIAGFKPSSTCEEQERIPYQPEWSMRALNQMIQLLDQHTLTAHIIATEPRLTMRLYNPDGTLTHTPLVEKGLAEYD